MISPIKIPNGEYHARSEWGSSSLKRILPPGSPAEARSYIMSCGQATLDTGTAIHGEVLEPGRQIILPAFNLRSKDGKAEALDWIGEKIGAIPGASAGAAKADEIRAAAHAAAAQAGKEVVSAADHEIAMSCARSVRANPVAAELLDGALCEQSYFAGHYKARPDGTTYLDNDIFELKSCALGTLEGDEDYVKAKLERVAEKLDYGLSLAHYTRVMSLCGHRTEPKYWRWIFVESKAFMKDLDGLDVHRTLVVRPSAEIISRSSDRMFMAHEILDECIKSDYWPGPAPQAEAYEISRPSWAITGEIE